MTTVERQLDGLILPPPSGERPRQLLVLCHGIGADGSQLVELAFSWARSLPNTAIAAPNGPFPHRLHHWPFGTTKGYEWFNPAAPETDGGTSIWNADALLDRFIDSQLKRLKLADDAYALAGFSQGAMVALFTGLRRRVAPCAIVSFAGALIGPELIAGERKNRAPVLLVHGEKDRIVQPARSRAAAAALMAAGIPVRTLYRPTLRHEIDSAGSAAAEAFLCEKLDIGGPRKSAKIYQKMSVFNQDNEPLQAGVFGGSRTDKSLYN
jgi:phospholipase/carboxylesterase